MAIGDFVGKFGSSGTGNGQFNGIWGFDIDSNYIYVAEQTNNRVQILNINSPWNYVNKFTVSAPYGIAVDNNYIYVRFISSINIYNKTSPYAQIGSFTTPTMIYSVTGIWVDDNYIYITFGNNLYSVYIYNKTSPYAQIGSFGGNGLGDGQFNGNQSPFNIYGDNNFLYVTDLAINNRVQIFNKTSYAFVGKFGSNGTGNGQFFNDPLNGLYVDNNYIYVTDPVNYRVQIFNKATYAFYAKFGSIGTANGQFENATYGAPTIVKQFNGVVYTQQVGSTNNAIFQMFSGIPAYIPGAQSGGGSGAGGGASGRHIKRRYMGRSLGR